MPEAKAQPCAPSAQSGPGRSAWPWLKGYLFAMVMVGLALLARFAFDRFWGNSLIYVTFFTAIVIIVWRTSLGPAVFAILLSFLLAVYFFIPPRHSFALHQPVQWINAAFFFFLSTVLLSFAQRVRGALQREQEKSAALSESEQRYRLLFDRNPDGVFSVDESGRFLEANPACEKISGYGKSELLEKSFLELCAPDQLTRTAEEFTCNLAAGRYGELETALMRKDGRRVELWLAGEPLRREGKLVVQCTAKDITEFKRAEWELQRLNAELERRVSERTAQAEQANQLLRRENEERQRIAEDLRASEERYRSLVEVSPDAICISRDDCIVFANRAGLRLFGAATPEQLLGKCLLELFRPRNRRQTLQDPEPMPFPFDGEIFCADGAVRQVEGTVCSGRDQAGTFLQIILRDITEQKLLDREILSAIEQERQRLGRELHDGLCHLLTATKFKLSIMERKLAQQSVIAPAEARALELEINRAIEQARAMAHGLHPVVLVGQGLSFALEELAGSVRETFSISCVCERSKAVVITDQPMALHLYRIAQEAVYNAARHGQARHVVIQLNNRENQLEMAVLDDGVGFASSPLSPGGMGLHNMKARATMLGAVFNIEPRPQGGTAVRCTLPLPSTPLGAGTMPSQSDPS